jgi:KaiC/GvpD/RAD55 family RecA-like ATPase
MAEIAIPGTPVSEVERKLAGFAIETCDDSPEWLSMMIYGVPGCGKTVLAGSASVVPEMSPVLFIDCEGGTVSLKRRYPKCHRIRVTNPEADGSIVTDWTLIEKIYQALRKGTYSYQTVVIDSVTELGLIAMQDR